MSRRNNGSSKSDKTTKWWSNSRTVHRGLEIDDFFAAKAKKDRSNTRTPAEMSSNSEDRQDYIAYLNAHEEGITKGQIRDFSGEEAMLVPPPRDDPEYYISRGPRWAPLISGTTADERNLVNKQLQQNAARDSRRAIAAGKPDPWAGSPYLPHVYIPELGRPMRTSPEIGGKVTAGVPAGSRVGKVVAGPSCVPAVRQSQRQLNKKSGETKGEVKGKGGRSAPKTNNGEIRVALSPIREENEVEETSGANFPMPSVETAAPGPVDSPGPRTDPAVAAALANYRGKRAPKRAATGEAEEERAAKRPKTAETSQPRRSTRLASREISASVAATPSPPRRIIKPTGARKPKPEAATTESTLTAPALPRVSKTKPAAPAPQKKPKSVLKPAPSKVTKTTKKKASGAAGAKNKTDTTAKPKRKKVKRACDECRRKHASCTHNQDG